MAADGRVDEIVVESRRERQIHQPQRRSSQASARKVEAHGVTVAEWVPID